MPLIGRANDNPLECYGGHDRVAKTAESWHAQERVSIAAQRDTFTGKSNVCCLSLAKTAVNDDGMKYLRGMNLQSLDLTATKVTDAGLATLGEFDFPRLKEISLEHTSITDAGLMHLANFKTLDWVSTAGTKVTKDGIRHLKAKLPEATILK